MFHLLSLGIYGICHLANVFWITFDD